MSTHLGEMALNNLHMVSFRTFGKGGGQNVNFLRLWESDIQGYCIGKLIPKGGQTPHPPPQWNPVT